MELAYAFNNVCVIETVQNGLTAEAQSKAMKVLTDIYYRGLAMDLSDRLSGEPLSKAQAAASGPAKRLQDAKDRLVEAEKEHAAKMAGLWGKFVPGQRVPSDSGGGVSTARAELTEAGSEPALAEVRALDRVESLIYYLRNTKPVNPDGLAVLAEALGEVY